MSKLKYLIVVAFLFSVATVQAQSKDEVIFIDFGDEKITKAEFKRVYQKNNSGEIISKSTVDEYLDLYINFKLKVKEAVDLEMNKDPAFIKELSGYRKQLAQPYLTADGIMEELKKEAYDRLQYDVKASHILIKLDQNASPEDTVAAYKRAIRVKKNLENGQDFELMAKQYSDDPSAKTNGGSLGYFTSFYMLYPFESAAYNTKVGKISEIVRTQYGYHVLKVVDKRPSVGNVEVAHILISNDQELSKTNDSEGKIKEIYAKIKQGEKFEDLAAQFSDDTRSAADGGVLPMFGVGRMVPEFEKAAFGLKADGDISEPFFTPYGWHIVKRLQHAPIGSFESVESELVQKIKKDSRANLSQASVINKIKNQYGFTENLKERDDFYKIIDSSFFKGTWSVDAAKGLTKELLKIGDKFVNQQDFAQYLENNKSKKVIDSRVLVNARYDAFKRASILEYKNFKLDEEYPDFRYLMQEYHDGILLFNLTDKLVWSEAVKDTSGLQAFYSTNKENYKWDKRVDAIVFSSLNKKVAEIVKTMLKEGKDVKEIIEEINRPSQLNLRYETKKYLKGENEIVDQVKWEKGISENVTLNGRFHFVKIKEVIEPTYKTLEDSRGLITSDYQNFLEKEWIQSLRSKNKLEVDKKILKELKTELN
ncbi:peptidylprolyl isomerase [Vicingaceae bacterium]|nr:peptidylprolyl isomerase [Vicingaceae bacterium]MDC1452124.1 peptidylprolyl isomerase [Vicingaceae bacterium]